MTREELNMTLVGRQKLIYYGKYDSSIHPLNIHGLRNGTWFASTNGEHNFHDYMYRVAVFLMIVIMYLKEFCHGLGENIVTRFDAIICGENDDIQSLATKKPLRNLKHKDDVENNSIENDSDDCDDNMDKNETINDENDNNGNNNNHNTHDNHNDGNDDVDDSNGIQKIDSSDGKAITTGSKINGIRDRFFTERQTSV